MCEGNAPYTDPLAQECVAECRPGQEVKGGFGADKMHCKDCEAGRLADHLNNLCGVECPAGTIENEDARNCDPDDSATLGDAVTDHSTVNDTHSDCDSSAPYLTFSAAVSVGVNRSSCVSSCPPGQGANESYNCVACVGDTPYTDHVNQK